MDVEGVDYINKDWVWGMGAWDLWFQGKPCTKCVHGKHSGPLIIFTS